MDEVALREDVDDEFQSSGRTLHIILQKAQACDIMGRAAQLAYYLLFAMFPSLLFVAVLISALPMPKLFDDLMIYFEGVLPPQAFVVVRGALEQSASRRTGSLLSISILATLWASSSGMEAIISSLNAAYQAKAARGWWRDRLLAIGLTLGLATFVIVSLVIVFFGGAITNSIAIKYGFGPGALIFWHVVQWPIAAVFVLFGLDLIYYLAPNIRQPWSWATLGSAVAVFAWLVASLGLRFYLTRFSNFNAYGALGSFMVLMLWLYLTSAAILFGGVINGVRNSMRRHIPVTGTDDQAAATSTRTS
jgi:membrane protein